MAIEITKIMDDCVHLHDASNYAREALGSPNHGFGSYQNSHGLELVVTTHVSDGAFRIVVRRKGTLIGLSVAVPLFSSHAADRVEAGLLKAAVEGLGDELKA